MFGLSRKKKRTFTVLCHGAGCACALVVALAGSTHTKWVARKAAAVAAYLERKKAEAAL